MPILLFVNGSILKHMLDGQQQRANLRATHASDLLVDLTEYGFLYQWIRVLNWKNADAAEIH